jgi:hypothetical protein
MQEIDHKELDNVRNSFARLQEAYSKVFPKVDQHLLNDFLSREAKSDGPILYTIEVFTKEGIDSEAARGYIMSKTGMAPAIFDNGTHYVTTQKLTLGMLKEICDSDDVLEVRGTYCGVGSTRGAAYDRAR